MAYTHQGAGMSTVLESVLNIPSISRIRRNHGLEHATIHVLSQNQGGLSLAGHSDAGGFWIIGDVETEALREAVKQALTRLRNGEEELAIHPNCGTNFVTTGTAAGLAGALAMFGAGRRWRDKIERLPLAMTLATLALLLTQPLGFSIQRAITTSGDPGNLVVKKIIPARRGQFNAHRILTEDLVIR
jgi:hypothetical protein